MLVIRAIYSDMLRALAVLSLAFLSFAHIPPVPVVYGASAAVATIVTCSGGLPGSGPEKPHKTCDLCRIAAGMDLPSIPCRIDAPMVLAEVVAASPYTGPARHVSINTATRPRAPPHVI